MTAKLRKAIEISSDCDDKESIDKLYASALQLFQALHVPESSYVDVYIGITLDRCLKELDILNGIIDGLSKAKKYFENNN